MRPSQAGGEPWLTRQPTKQTVGRDARQAGADRRAGRGVGQWCCTSSSAINRSDSRRVGPRTTTAAAIVRKPTSEIGRKRCGDACGHRHHAPQEHRHACHLAIAGAWRRWSQYDPFALPASFPQPRQGDAEGGPGPNAKPRKRRTLRPSRPRSKRSGPSCRRRSRRSSSRACKWSSRRKTSTSRLSATRKFMSATSSRIHGDCDRCRMVCDVAKDLSP